MATNSFGDLVREYRRNAGMTQEELADAAGVSPRSISELERGAPLVPRRDTVGRLAEALALVGPVRAAFEATVEAQRRSRSRLAPERARRVEAQDERLHNLPLALTSFIGREQDLAELEDALVGAPLLTLTGPGGVGKTRLALELGRRCIGTFADGVWLVELAELTDPSHLPEDVACFLGLRDAAGDSALMALIAHFRSQQRLLILDNCEHVAAAVASFVNQVLEHCPGVRVLVTSREPLGIDGEIRWQVAPLATPDTARVLSLEQLRTNPSARLFVERAQSISSALQLSDASVPAIVRICTAVDGLPLALELAAARVTALALEQLADRLESDIAVLRRTGGCGLPQHATIRATIDWSYNLLGAHEKLLVRRLAVFVGGWSLALAEEVCCDTEISRDALLDILTSLVDKSMVLADVGDTVAHYRMLLPIRQYALEHLAASEEFETFHSRHALALLNFARTAGAGRAGPEEAVSLNSLGLQHGNIRAALRWALDHGNAEQALIAARALFRFWERRGHIHEGRTWITEALHKAPGASARERCKGLNALAFLYWCTGDVDRAQQPAERALTLARDTGSTRDKTQALLNLAMIADVREEHRAAVALLQEAVGLARASGRMALLGLALSYLGRSLLRACGSDDGSAASLLEESLSLAEAVDARYVSGHALETLGDIAWEQRATAEAQTHWLRALTVRSIVGDRLGLIASLERLAWSMAETQQFDRAVWLFGAADAQRIQLDLSVRHDERRDHARLLAESRKNLGSKFASILADGQRASTDEAIARAANWARATEPLRFAQVA